MILVHLNPITRTASLIAIAYRVHHQPGGQLTPSRRAPLTSWLLGQCATGLLKRGSSIPRRAERALLSLKERSDGPNRVIRSSGLITRFKSVSLRLKSPGMRTHASDGESGMSRRGAVTDSRYCPTRIGRVGCTALSSCRLDKPRPVALGQSLRRESGCCRHGGVGLESVDKNSERVGCSQANVSGEGPACQWERRVDLPVVLRVWTTASPQTAAGRSRLFAIGPRDCSWPWLLIAQRAASSGGSCCR